MEILSQLDQEETDIFMHLVNNKARNMNNQTQLSNDLIDEACSDDFK